MTPQNFDPLQFLAFNIYEQDKFHAQMKESFILFVLTVNVSTQSIIFQSCQEGRGLPGLN